MIDGPKTELHRHLDGSLRPDTVADLAAEVGLTVPKDLLFSPGMGLEAALQKFAFTVSLLQRPENLTRVAHEMCEDAADEGIGQLEIRFAPQLHTHSHLDRIVDAVLDGIGGRAGLILCGLYGDSPELIEGLVQLAETRPAVVGIDLAGGPSKSQRWQLEDYGEAFARARRMGLGRTVHAGEGRPVDEIRAAIKVLDAQRIGHGVPLLDDPEVVELVLERGITIEACPTSNWHTGIIARVSDHPLSDWLRLGVSVAVCTDNTLLSNIDLPGELERVRVAHGLSDGQMDTLARNAANAVFSRS